MQCNSSYVPEFRELTADEIDVVSGGASQYSLTGGLTQGAIWGAGGAASAASTGANTHGIIASGVIGFASGFGSHAAASRS